MMKYCLNCEQHVQPRKKFSALLWIGGGFLTGGILLVLYPVYYLAAQESTCPLCKSVNWGVKRNDIWVPDDSETAKLVRWLTGRKQAIA